jgi:hypothetical protein
LEHLGKVFSQISSSIKIYQFPKNFEQKSQDFNLYNLPKIIGQKKNSQTTKNFFKHPGKHFARILQSAQFFGQHGKRNPKFPQATQTFHVYVQ